MIEGGGRGGGVLFTNQDSTLLGKGWSGWRCAVVIVKESLA